MELQPRPEESRENPGKELMNVLREQYPRGVIASFNFGNEPAEQPMVMFREKATPEGSWIIVTEDGFFEVGTILPDTRNPNAKVLTDQENLSEFFKDPDAYTKADLQTEKKSFAISMPTDINTGRKLVFEIRNNGKPLLDDTKAKLALENSIQAHETKQQAKKPLASMLESLRGPRPKVWRTPAPGEQGGVPPGPGPLVHPSDQPNLPPQPQL